jgi:hypothetical protein
VNGRQAALRGRAASGTWLPGAVHDLSAARTHAIIEALTDAKVMTFADKA